MLLVVCQLSRDDFLKTTSCDIGHKNFKIIKICVILFQGTAVVPLIKFFSFLCLLLGFALFALHMEFHPSFTTAWFSNALDEPLDIGTLDWGPETTKQTDVKREGSTGGKFIT